MNCTHDESSSINGSLASASDVASVYRFSFIYIDSIQNIEPDACTNEVFLLFFSV